MTTERNKPNWIPYLPYIFSLFMSGIMFYTGIKVQETKDDYEKRAIIYRIEAIEKKQEKLESRLENYTYMQKTLEKIEKFIDNL